MGVFFPSLVWTVGLALVRDTVGQQKLGQAMVSHTLVG
jgi:hypothetical protein